MLQVMNQVCGVLGSIEGISDSLKHGRQDKGGRQESQESMQLRKTPC